MLQGHGSRGDVGTGGVPWGLTPHARLCPRRTETPRVLAPSPTSAGQPRRCLLQQVCSRPCLLGCFRANTQSPVSAARVSGRGGSRPQQPLRGWHRGSPAPLGAAALHGDKSRTEDTDVFFTGGKSVKEMGEPCQGWGFVVPRCGCSGSGWARGCSPGGLRLAGRGSGLARGTDARAGGGQMPALTSCLRHAGEPPRCIYMA